MSIDDRLPAEPDVGAIDGHDGASQPTRRGFLKAAGIGGALVAGGTTLLPLLGGTAGAQASEAADDLVLFEVAMTLEYAAAQLYEDAIDGGTLDDETTSRIRQFGPNHQVHGDTIGDTLTVISTDETFDVAKLELPNPKLYDAFSPRVEGGADQNAVLGVLEELESVLAATLQSYATTMTNATDARVLMSIQMVDAQQEVILARLLSQPLPEYTPTVEPTDGALSAEEYK